MTQTADDVTGLVVPEGYAGLKWLPLVDEDNCTGCNLCVEACDAMSLELIKRLAVLVEQANCISEEECVKACPEDAIRMKWVPLEKRDEAGRWHG